MSGFDIASFRDKLPRSRKPNTTFDLQDDASSGSDSSDSDYSSQKRKKSRRVLEFSQPAWSDESDNEKDAAKESIETKASGTATATTTATATSSTSVATEQTSQQYMTLLDDDDDDDDDLKDKKKDDTFIILSDGDDDDDIKELRDLNGSMSPKRSHHNTSEPQPSTLPKRPKISLPTFQQIEDLDPDLASILPGSAPSPSSTSQSPSRATSHSPAPAQKVLIKVCYTTPRIPDDERLQVLIDKLKKPLSVYVMENDPFDKLLTRYAQHKKLRKDDLQLVYKDVPVVLRATPASLDMITGGQTKNLMQVYVKSDYEKIIQEELQKKEEMEKMFEKPITDEELFAANTTTATAATTEESTQSADTEDRLFLKLRGKEGDDVVCRVKKTTTMANLAKHYCAIKKLGDSVASKIELSFEGETLSPNDCVEDTELESEDIVTVTIK
ncbi:predicted protein [Lichtheimia corymbifera JMRC:FSU:9682]|uniref:Rad60/SUMO-like domain-containing protein n=1 Tax=Lichtheimia corymbifera JMRC:FSU:9682 TaxID=1263082 RepID=A0A068SEI5_9FUNG|nr:predicted protein [Lichtheimia corymbifera JMRC:FSU:9682]